MEQALVIALLKRQAALVKVEIQGRRVHNAKLCYLVARRHTRALLFEGAARSAQAKEICRPVTVGNCNLAGHKPVVDTDCHGKARLGRHGVEHGGSGEVSVFAQHGQCHAAEFAHLFGGDMDRRATRQQTRQKRCGMLGKRRIGAARAVRVDQIGNVARGKAVHIGRQAQVVAATGRRRDLGGKERRLFCRGLVLPHRRQLNRYLVGTMRRRSPRPGGLKGNGPATQQVQHVYDVMLGQRQLALGDKAAACKIVRRRTRTRDVAQIHNRCHNKVEQTHRNLVKGLGRMEECELFAVRERAAAHVGGGHAVDVLDHVGHRAAADAKLERPAKPVGKQRIVVRHQRGLQHRLGGIGVDSAGELAAHARQLIHASVRKIGERLHEARARGNWRREGKVRVDGRCGGRGTRGLLGRRRKRADRRAQPLDGLNAAGIQVRQRRGDGVLAHAGVAIGSGAIAVVVDHLVLVHVERHVRLVQVAARATHCTLNRHVFGEARATVLDRQHGAVEHERTPLHKGAAQRRLFPERLHKRPLCHHFLQSTQGS